MKFKIHERKIRAPFAIYCDFERIANKMHMPEPRPDEAYTQCCQKHECCGYGLQVVSCLEGFEYDPVVYRGADAIERFIDNILDLERELAHYVYHPKEIIMTQEDISNSNKTHHCHICNERFNPLDKKKR